MNKKHFEKLTPINNVELGIYEDALNFVFENDDIKNIAVTGAYGAGKSSVIESYKYRYKEIKFLNISLANFDEINQEDSENAINENLGKHENDKIKNVKKHKTASVKESVLEGKILNQLIHKIDSSKIPQTNFKVKQKISNRNIIKLTLLSLVYILSAFYMYFYNTWNNYVEGLQGYKLLGILKFTTNWSGLFISGLILSILSGIVVFNIIKFEKNRNIFKKLKFQGNEIEIFEKSEESYFDKYLNEVLYIFDNSNVDVIVFEDMDRYNVNQIFQRLREINNLINSKRIKEKNKPLRFVYLLRDDIFISKDRTKFFDFIIPIVPVVDSSNSYDQFIKHLKAGEVFEKFDEYFLQQISLYVDDMRILKNIYNEFMIYNSRISTTEQTYNKLLAIIVYKNIFPRDFSDTQNNIGFVSTLFNSKEEIIKSNINSINSEIKKLQDIISRCNNEHVKNLDELGKLFTKYHYLRGDYIDDGDSEYINRKQAIDVRNNDQIDDLKNKIKKLEARRLELKNKKVKDLINRQNIDAIFSLNYKNFLNEENDFKEIKGSQYFGLIRFLIRNGHIDETYEDYITYFYPNSLTANDKMFLRSVTDKSAKDWNYKIDNHKLVLSKLRKVDFLEIETLNFSLFNYILENRNEHEESLITIIDQLKNKKHFKFVEQYFDYSSYHSIPCTLVINKYWTTFLKEMINESKFRYDNQKEYILLTIYWSSIDIIDKINKDNILTETISSDTMFLNIKEPDLEKLIPELLRIGVKFKNLNYEKSHKDLFKAVYQNNLYELTFENISLMLRKIYGIKSGNDILHKNYSLLYKGKTSKLYEYVNENIKEYMSLLLDNCEGEIKDAPEAAIEIINNENISIQNRSLYVQYLETELQSLKDIKELNLWDSLLIHNVIKYSEDNILYYFFEKGKKLDETLVNFINGNDKSLKFLIKHIDSILGKNSTPLLFDEVIICDKIHDNKYKNMLAHLNFYYDTFEIVGISESKVKILIDLGIIKMTADNVEFMKENYESQFLYFIIKNIDKYVDNVMEDKPLSYEDLISILELDVEDSFKIKLISNTDESILVINKNYSEEIIKYILQHNFDESELRNLIKSYEKRSDSLKKVLREISLTYIETIIQENIKLPLDIFKYLIQENITTDNKFMILIANMDSYSREQCEEFIKRIGSKEHEKLFTTGRPKLEVNEINEAILEKFKVKGWISSFQEAENGIYKIYGKNLKKETIDPILL